MITVVVYDWMYVFILFTHWIIYSYTYHTEGVIESESLPILSIILLKQNSYLRFVTQKRKHKAYFLNLRFLKNGNKAKIYTADQFPPRQYRHLNVIRTTQNLKKYMSPPLSPPNLWIGWHWYACILCIKVHIFSWEEINSNENILELSIDIMINL